MTPGNAAQDTAVRERPYPRKLSELIRLIIILHVHHLKVVAVHRLADQVPGQVGRPAQCVISQMSIPLRHGRAFVGQKTLQDVQVNFPG